MNHDLISRSALLANIGDLGIDPEDDTTFLTTGQACAIAHKCIVAMVKEEPAVDAVEVVRCKDCKNSFEDDFDGSLWCCRDVEREVVDNHFCSYGERRTDDGN